MFTNKLLDLGIIIINVNSMHPQFHELTFQFPTGT